MFGRSKIRFVKKTIEEKQPEAKTQGKNQSKNKTKKEKNMPSEAGMRLRGLYSPVEILKKANIQDRTIVVFCGSSVASLNVLAQRYVNRNNNLIFAEKLTTIPDSQIKKYTNPSEKTFFVDFQDPRAYITYKEVTLNNGEKASIGYDKFYIDAAVVTGSGLVFSCLPEEENDLYSYLSRQTSFKIVSVYVDLSAEEILEKKLFKYLKRVGHLPNQETIDSVFSDISEKILEEKETTLFSERSDVSITSISKDSMLKTFQQIDSIRKWLIAPPMEDFSEKTTLDTKIARAQ